MKILYIVLFSVLSLQAMATAPTTPASNLRFPAIDGGFFNVGWTAGNGARRLIICRAASPVTFIPQNGVDYNENTNFASGQQVSPGEYVVYDNAFTSFFLTGLNPATQYFFAVFEYNGTGASIEYLTSSFLSGSATTSATPADQTNNAFFTSITTNSVVLNWTNGNGARRLIVVREAEPVNADPVNNHQYNVNAVFGTGESVGTGNFTVYNSSSTGTSVTNLKPGTQYFFSFYEFNGINQPQYKIPAYTTSVTTRSIPTVATSNVVITKTDGKELSLNWANGNGQRRIIIAKQGSDINSVPSNGIDYTANNTFGLGQQVGAGEYVVYDDNFNAAIITGLNPATVYFFKIFEYDGTGVNTIYLTSSFGSINAATAATPSIQTSAISASNITAAGMLLHFTNGNGRARIIVGKKGTPVDIVPTDLIAYDINANLGNGNFVFSNTTNATAAFQSLEPNSTYHFAVFEYNGYNQPLYLSPAADFSATTLFSLPVKLVKWEARPSNGRVYFQWVTASEANVSHFSIERSTNGVQFSSLVTIPANGNSQANITYASEDNSPLNGKSWYRLKMVDNDGKSEYSPVRMVLINTTQAVMLMNNPVRDKLELVTTGSQGQWKIIGTGGQCVNRGLITSTRTSINISSLASGSYWIVVSKNEQLQSLGFMKL